MRMITAIWTVSTYLLLALPDTIYVMGDANGPDLAWVAREPCDRGLSRQVRSFIEKEVYPKLSMAPNELPSTCQLHPDQDMYAGHEKHKHEETRMDWKCSYCSKRFKTEFYLDKHMHNMHEDKLVEGVGNMCLASLCPIFGCRDSLSASGAYKQHQKLQKRTTSSGKVQPNRLPGEKNFDFDAACTNADVEKSKYQCEVMIRRCFGSSNELYDHFEEEICEKLHCQDGVLRGSIISSHKTVSSVTGGYDGGSGSADPHSAYNLSDDDSQGGTFLRKLFLVLSLMALLGYMAFYIFCGSSMGAQITAYFGKGKYSAAGTNTKGKYREAQANPSFVKSASRLMGSRKRHDS